MEQETSKHEIAAENFQRRIDELMEKVAEAEGEAHKNALRWREEKDRCSEVQRELEDLRDKYERATLDPNLDSLSVESASMHSASSPVEQEDIGAQQKRRAVLTRQVFPVHDTKCISHFAAFVVSVVISDTPLMMRSCMHLALCHILLPPSCVSTDALPHHCSPHSPVKIHCLSRSTQTWRDFVRRVCRGSLRCKTLTYNGFERR